MIPNIRRTLDKVVIIQIILMTLINANDINNSKYNDDTNVTNDTNKRTCY